MAETPPPPVSPLARALIPISQCSPGDPNKSIKTPEVCSLDVSKTSFTTPRRQFFLSKRKLEPPSSSSPTQPKTKKVKHGPGQTPQSEKSKTGWCLLLLKSGGNIQVKPMVQSARGKKGLFTSAGTNSPLRPSWNSVLDCELERKPKPSGIGIKCEFLCTSSDNDKHGFRLDLIDPFMNSKDPFTQKTSEYVVNNPKLFGYYISLMSRSENFFNHSSEKHDKHGFVIAGGGITIEMLKEVEGSLEGLEEFIKLGEENCVDMGQADSDNVRARSKKITDFFNPKMSVKKLSKQEIVEKNFRDEVSVEGGLEKSLVSQYVDFNLIPIGRLHKSPQLFLKVIKSKVQDLAASMYERYDPSAVVLMVCPSDFEQFEKTGEAEIYHVVHGTHRLAALKLLDERGHLTELPGMTDKKVACYVIKKATAVVSNYCNMRSNDLSSEYPSNPHIYQMVFVYIGLLKCSKDDHQSQDAIMKLCHSRRVPQDDISAIMRICQWGTDALNKLSTVLEKYQNYATSDPKERGEKASIRKRQAKKMSKTLFRSLSKVPEDVFVENHGKVMNNAMSFNELVNVNESNVLLRKTERNAVLAAGVDTTEELKTRFPKFDNELLQNFLGAEVYGKKANKQGELLKNYIKSLKDGKEYEVPVQITECDKVWEIGSEMIDGFDIVVVETLKVPEDYLKFLINHIGSTYSPSDDESKTILLVLHCQTDLIEVFKQLDCWRSKPGFSIDLLMFEKEKGKLNEQKLKENATYCVCFGKLNVYDGELKSLNKSIESELAKIVNQLSKPSAKIALISMGNGEVLPLHKTNDKRQVNYFVNKKIALKLNKKFLVNGPPRRALDEEWSTMGAGVPDGEADGEIVTGGEEEEYDNSDDSNEETGSGLFFERNDLIRSDSTSSQ